MTFRLHRQPRVLSHFPDALAAVADRQGELSAVQEVRRDYGIPVVAVAGLGDLMAYLEHHPEFSTHQTAVARYREQYGVSS